MPSSGNTHNRPIHRRESDMTSDFHFTWRHVGLGGFVSALGLYSVFALVGWQEAWPPQLNSVVLTNIAVGVVTFCQLVCSDARRRQIREQAAEDEEEDTEPLRMQPVPRPVPRPAGPVYLSSVAHRRSPVDEAADNLMQRLDGFLRLVDERIDARLADLDVLADNEHMLNGGPHGSVDGSVARLPRRRT